MREKVLTLDQKRGGDKVWSQESKGVLGRGEIYLRQALKGKEKQILLIF